MLRHSKHPSPSLTFTRLPGGTARRRVAISSGSRKRSVMQWGQISPHQPLRHGAHQGRADQEALDAEVDQAGDGGGGVVGVEGGEDQVAGERRLDGVLRGLVVADLADHDDVGVLAQDVAQGGREGDPDLELHLGLVEVLVDHLDRVLDRGDVDLAGADGLEGGVERGRLARAGGAGDQDDAVRAGDEVVEGVRARRRRSRAPRGPASPPGDRRCASRPSRRRRPAGWRRGARPRGRRGSS